jgi:hypothetical protein
MCDMTVGKFAMQELASCIGDKHWRRFPQQHSNYFLAKKRSIKIGYFATKRMIGPPSASADAILAHEVFEE